jgi:prepilin-type N-terminal cleavage/methylation domain-containing protein
MKKAFTLIELLIVIALLGALAVGLLAALDPFEQLKKGVDTGTRNTVSELHGAVIRYYAIKNAFPWTTDLTWTTAASAYATNISPIIATGELKADFSTLAGGQLANIYLASTVNNESITVCFKPTSKSFKSDPNTKYTNQGLDGCVAGAGVDCYWCVK